MQLIQTTKNFAKLIFAGATIAAIAFTLIGTTPTTTGVDVTPATADVFFGTRDTSHVRFTRAVEASGLKPRPYDMNGNVIYFAAGQTQKRPLEALHHYQEAFVREGLNSRNWANHPTRTEVHAAAGDHQDMESARKIQDLADATLRGEVVPEVKSPGYVTMTGLAVPDRTRDRSDFIDNGTYDGKFRFAAATRGFRMVEAMWDPDVQRTQITAVWTADEFDEEKMTNRAFVQSPPDTDLPACAGCSREVAFKSLNPGEPFRSDSYRTASSPDATHAFYTKSLTAQGWAPTGVQRKLDWLAAELPDEPGLGGGRLLDLRHEDGRTATIAILWDPAGGTRVMTMRD